MITLGYALKQILLIKMGNSVKKLMLENALMCNKNLGIATLIVCFLQTNLYRSFKENGLMKYFRRLVGKKVTQ